MKQWFKSIFPKEFKDQPSRWRGFALGLVILFMLVGQLFSFEDLPAAFFAMGIPGGRVVEVGLSYLVVLVELMSLPFAFSMKMNSKLYKLSRCSLVLVGAIWLILALLSVLLAQGDGTVAIFGASIPLIGGWWFVLFAGLLFWSALLARHDLKRRA